MAKKKKRTRPNVDYNKKTRDQLSGGDWWTPERGVKNTIRVMPPYNDEGICILRRVLHYGFEVDGRNRAFPCLEDNEPWLDESPCPICHVWEKLKKGDADEREAAEEIKPSSAKFVVNMVDCKRPEKGVLFWAAPLSFGRYFLSLLEDEDIEDITDPDEGFDIIVEVSGKGRGTKYDFRMRPKKSKISYEDWEENLNNLTEVTEVKDAGELIVLLQDGYGTAFDIDEYLEDFDKPKKKKKEEEDDPTYSTKDIEKMKKKPLLKLMKTLDIDPDDYDDLDEMREEVIDELGLED